MLLHDRHGSNEAFTSLHFDEPADKQDQIGVALDIGGTKPV